MTAVLLLGGSIPSLAAALDLAKVGIRVLVADAPVSLPRRDVRDHDGALAALLEELAQPLSEEGHPEPVAVPVLSSPPPVRMLAKDGKWKPLPEPSVCGIPAVPLSSDCIALLGAGGAFRVYLDRLKPVLTIGKQENLGRLVSSRIGDAAREALVEPIVREDFGVSASGVDVAIAAPGLNEALTRAGSLTGAAAQLSERAVARETTIRPAGGWSDFAALMLERLFLYGAERLEGALLGLEAVEDADLSGSDGLGDGGGSSEWILTDAHGATRTVSAIIVDDASAMPESSALREAIGELSPSRWRVYAEFGIREPEFAAELGDAGSEGADPEIVRSGSGRPSTAEALRTVSDAAGRLWTGRVSLRPGEDGAEWIVRCASPVSPRSETENLIASADGLPPALGLVVEREADVWVESAPYATHADRDVQENLLHAWRLEEPNALVCGQAHYGSELAVAVAQSRAQAVQLGRRLVGIAD